MLYESGAALSDVYFPTTAYISLLYVMENGASAEIAIVANEGIVGVSRCRSIGKRLGNRVLALRDVTGYAAAAISHP